LRLSRSSGFSPRSSFVGVGAGPRLPTGRLLPGERLPALDGNLHVPASRGTSAACRARGGRCGHFLAPISSSETWMRAHEGARVREDARTALDGDLPPGRTARHIARGTAGTAPAACWRQRGPRGRRSGHPPCRRSRRQHLDVADGWPPATPSRSHAVRWSDDEPRSSLGGRHSGGTRA
jgi:hypothetical protein